MSLPSRGAWIEIFLDAVQRDVEHLSLPSRGAWIEMYQMMDHSRQASQSLPSRGAWIEINYGGAPKPDRRRRSPHGERGLKFSRVFEGG